MTKQEFLAMSLPFGVKAMLSQTGKFNLDEEYPEPHNEVCSLVNVWIGESFEYEISDGNIGYGFIEENEFDLILRPLTDLTKPISQANYNNGEPFIPALELVKLEEKYNKWKDIAPNIPYDVKIINKPFGQVLKVSKLDKWVIFLALNEIERAKHYVVTQLIKWHFNLMDEGEKFVDVNTLETNPYK